LDINNFLIEQCFENLPLMLYNVGLDGKIVNCNCLAAENLGYKDKKELIGKSVFSFYAPSSQAKAKNLFQKWQKSGKLENEELQVVTKKEEVLDVTLNVRTIHDEKGAPLLSLSTHLDITKQKNIERKLRESERFGFTLLNNSPIAIIVIEQGRRIKYVNSAFEKLTGFTSAEILGTKPPYLWWTVRKGTKTYPEFESAMLEGALKVEQLFQKKNMKKFWVEITSTPIMSNGILKYYISNWVDISERKIFEIRMQQNQKVLQDSEKELKRFSRKILSIREEEKKKISSLIHDEAGCMVVGLSSRLSAIEEEIKNQNYSLARKEITKCKKSIKKCGSNLRKIAVDLRPPDLTIIGLKDALHEYINDLQKSNKMNIELKDNMEAVRVGDKTAIMLYRIAQESLNNVYKHANAKNVKVKLGNTIDKIELLVQDDGDGFNLKKKEGRQDKHLGLRSMKEMTESLEGVFRIDSKMDVGTMINVSIPHKTREG